MEPLQSAWFYPIALFVALLTGVGKSGFGMAGGLPVPLLALVISPAQGAAIMLPLLLVTDVASVYAYRRHWDRANMKLLLPAGLIGTALGWATFKVLDESALRIVLGLIAVCFVMNTVLRRPVPATRPSRARGYFWGAVSGLTSFVAQAGGPPLWVYLLPQRLEKRLHTGTTVMFFAALNVAKIYPYFALGLLTAGNLAASAAMVPVGLAGIPLGIWMQRRVSSQWFFRVTYTLLFIAGVQLLYQGVKTRLA
jgi:uncharacterized membrane protein YfcA